jgi:L-lysine 2,3-aminomutase
MVKERDAPWPAGAWRKDLAEAVTDVGELLRLLGLDDGPQAVVPSALRGFPLRVPRAFVDRMRPGDPDDPLLRQVLPLAREDKPAPGFNTDPVEGAAQLGVAEERARELMSAPANRLPGYLVPSFSREVVGAPAKVGVDLRS